MRIAPIYFHKKKQKVMTTIKKYYNCQSLSHQIPLNLKMDHNNLKIKQILLKLNLKI